MSTRDPARADGEPDYSDGGEEYELAEEGPPPRKARRLGAAEKFLVALIVILIVGIVGFELIPKGEPPPLPGIPDDFATGCDFSGMFSCENFAIDNQTGMLELQVNSSLPGQVVVTGISCGDAAVHQLPNPVTAVYGTSSVITGWGSGNAIRCALDASTAFEAVVCIEYLRVDLGTASACGVLAGDFSPTRPVSGNLCSPSCGGGSACVSSFECASRFCGADGTCAACTSNCGEGVPCAGGGMCASGSCIASACTCSHACPDGSACSDARTCVGGACVGGACLTAGKFSLSGCKLVSEPGAYILTSDVAASATCFQVRVPGVSIDCQGHRVTGKNAGTAFDVQAAGVRIENCRVEWFEYGIASGWQDGGLFVENSSFSNNTVAALELSSPHSSVSSSSFFANGVAVHADATAGGLSIAGNTFASNKGDAIRADFAAGGVLNVSGNSIVGSAGVAIHANGITGSSIANNTIANNSGGGIVIYGNCSANAITGNRIEASGQAGISAACGGNALTGNFVYGATGSGIAFGMGENRVDNNSVCASGGSDILCGADARASGGGNTCMATSCQTSCTPCPFVTTCMTLNKPGRYWLTNDISSRTTCISIAVDGVSLGCRGHLITGAGSGTGIAVSGARNVAIADCNVAGFIDGISFKGASGTLERSSSNGSVSNGLAIESSTVNVSDSGFFHNLRHGVSAFSSSVVGFENVTAVLNSADGFNLADGTFYLHGAIARGNDVRGIYLGGAGEMKDTVSCGNYGAYQFYCEQGKSVTDSGNNTCRPAYQCGVNCAACP